MSWDDLYQTSPSGHVFASSAYLDLIGRAVRGRGDDVTFEVDGRAAASARFLVRRSPIVPRVIVPPYTPYSAVLLDRMPSEAETHHRTSNLEHLLKELESRYSGVDLHLPPKLIDVRTFSWRRWAVQPLYTYRVSLSGGAPSEQWSESAKRIARRADSDYEIVDPGARRLADLSVASYERKSRRSPLSKARLTRLLEEATEGAGARLYGARNKQSGEIESAVAVLQDGNSAYYWIAGGTAGPGMTVLLAELFEQLADEGIDSFDFVGANTDSIAEFKRRFGGRLTTYFRATWRKGPLVTLEDTLARLR